MDREGNLLFRFTEQGQSTVSETMLSDIPQENFKGVEKISDNLATNLKGRYVCQNSILRSQFHTI